MRQGIDTKTDPKQLDPGKFLTIENGVFLKNGEVQKANGYATKAASLFPLTDVYTGCATLKDSLFITGQSGAYAYNPSTDSLATVGRYVPLTVSKKNAINQDAGTPSCAYDPVRNTMILVWVEYDYSTSPVQKIKYSVRDLSTNSVIVPEQLITDGTYCKVVTSDALDYFLIVYEDISNNLRYTTVSKALLNAGSIGLLDNSTYLGNGFNVYAEGTSAAFAVWSSGALGTNTTKMATFSTSGTVSVTGTATLSGAGCGYGSDIKVMGSTVYFGLSDGTNVRTVGYNFGLTAITSALQTVMTRASSSRLMRGVVFSYDPSVPGTYLHIFSTQTWSSGTIPIPSIERAVITSSGIYQAQVTWIRGAVLTSNPIQDLTNSAAFNAYYMPIKAIQSFVNGVPGNAGFYTGYLVRMPNYAEYNPLNPANYYVAAIFYDYNLLANSTAVRNPLFYTFVKTSSGYFGLISETAGNASFCIFNFTHTPIFCELANNLHVTGGYLGMFDGAEFAEHGFIQQPLQPILASTSGTLPAATYYYSVVYEWQDAFGQIHISVPSDPVSITLGSPLSVNLNIPTLKLTNKTSQVYIAVYRSIDGINFYRLPNTGITSNVQSRKTADTILVNDDTSTAVLLSQPLLYTSGGSLPNTAAPPCTFIANYKRRMVLVPSEDQNSVYYSKDITPAAGGNIGTPVEWATEFVLSVDEKGGSIQGVIQLDDKLVIGKATSISVVVGEGPANNGTNNDFSTPQLLATDTGFESGRSLILLPIGVLFKSPKGYYLLDRSLSVSYLGAPVEAFNNNPCRSAVLLYDRNEVWFCNSVNTIVYNYYYNMFSTVNYTLTHACIYQNKYTGVLNSLIYQETPGTYTRNGTGYSMTLTTGWISFANIQGFQRVYKLLLLGTFKSDHQLRVTCAFDFVETPTQTTTWTIMATPGDVMQYRLFTNRQKCEAIKFSVTDLAWIGSFAQSYSLSNMAFEVGIKKGPYKLPASKSVG